MILPKLWQKLPTISPTVTYEVGCCLSRRHVKQLSTTNDNAYTQPLKMLVNIPRLSGFPPTPPSGAIKTIPGTSPLLPVVPLRCTGSPGSKLIIWRWTCFVTEQPLPGKSAMQEVCGCICKEFKIIMMSLFNTKIGINWNVTDSSSQVLVPSYGGGSLGHGTSL